MKSEGKPTKIDRVKLALYRTMTEATPSKVGTAKWVLYGSAAITTMLLFAADGPNFPKIPRSYGD